MSIFSSLIDWYMGNINYFTITLLMAIESSFIPLPSELVIPPAAWKAAEGSLNIYLVVACSTFGSLIGALFNYLISMSLGRLIIYKFADSKIGHLCLLSIAKLEKAEHYFVKHGNMSTFLGRLVPVIRHLISIPAGISKMPIGKFIMYTVLGAFLWSSILAAMGYFLRQNKNLIYQYSNELSHLMLVLGILFVAYLVYQGYKKKKRKESKS